MDLDQTVFLYLCIRKMCIKNLHQYTKEIMLVRTVGRQYLSLCPFATLPEMSMNTTCDLVYLILQKFINILI